MRGFLGRLVSTIVCVGVLGVATLSSQGITPVPTGRTVLGMIGLAAGQTLRLNVVAFPPTPCAAILRFVDANGTPVGPTARFVRLAPGQADGLSVSSQALGVPFGRRVQLRPELQPPGPADTLSGCVATAELIDQATRFTTSFVAAAGQVPPGPSDFGMIGLAPFGVLRLNVVAYPPTPCTATLSFADANGNTVGSSQLVALAPGQAASLDLSRSAVPPGPADTPPGPGDRVEVRPVETQDVPGGCVATAEVFDVFSARTWAFAPPGPND